MKPSSKIFMPDAVKLKQRLEYLEQLVTSIWEVLYISEDIVGCYTEAVSTIDIQKMVNVTLEGIKRFVPTSTIAYFRINEETFEFEPFLVLPEEDKKTCVDEIDAMISKGFFGWGIRQNKLSTFKPITVSEEKAKGILFIPLYSGIKIMGVIIVFTKVNEEDLSQEIFKLVELISRQASFSIENSILYRDLKLEHEALEISYAKVEEKVKERTKQLEDIKNELESFAHNVSHELSAPLFNIQGYSTLILDQYTDSIGDGGVKFVNNIQKAAGQADKLISDMLRLAKSGRVVGELKEFNLNDIVQAAMKQMELKCRDKNATITAPNDFPTVKTDKNRLGEVFQNLISNSLKYIDEDKKPEIKISWRDNQDSYLLWVKDNGIGIAADKLENVFEPFKRLKEIRVEGTGVGLAIIKKIVENLGGKIWVKSEGKGKGATFFFTLPKEFKKDDL